MDGLAELSIKDFKVIKRADIQLSGITVVSGVNGCGKSTMSKLLYYAFRNANSFDKLVLDSTISEIKPYINILEQIELSIYHLGIKSKDIQSFNKFRFICKDLDSISFSNYKTFLHSIKELCNKFLEYESFLNTQKKSILTNRLKLIFFSTFKQGDSISNDFKKMLDILINKISDSFSKAEKLIIDRPSSILKKSLDSCFDISLAKSITLKEYGDVIIGEGVQNIPLLHYIKKVAYIDTPMVIGMETTSTQPIYWEELNSLLKNPPKRGYKRSINDFIKNKIIMGDVSFDDDIFSGGFKYKRNDGKEYNLLECATGVKSFSLLQLLLKNLFLDESTLLIIDEPEVHLHPQWIVEYANLIVSLHKKVGVKFFIASHSTDMVSAIRYISEKEKCLNSLSFYLAENENNKKSEHFMFRSLKHDIEPIFHSFNKSFETLDNYAGR